MFKEDVKPYCAHKWRQNTLIPVTISHQADIGMQNMILATRGPKIAQS